MEANLGQLQGRTEIIELPASRTIDIRGIRSLDETLHVSFDVDDRGAVWMYRFGWLRRREESQVFRLDRETGRPTVFPIPEALQRLPFAVFCAGAGLVYLLGCPAASPGVPTGFALDRDGRIAGAFHLRAPLLDAAVDPSRGLWVATTEPDEAGERRLLLEYLSLHDELGTQVSLEDWVVGQLSCLAVGDGRILLGGTGLDGATRVQAVTRTGRSAVKCENIGQPLALGFGPHGELLCLGAGGRLVRVTTEVIDELRLLDPGGRPLRGIATLRFGYRRIFALSAKRDRILEFNL